MIYQRYPANENSFANFEAAKKRIDQSPLRAKTARGLAGFGYSFFHWGSLAVLCRLLLHWGSAEQMLVKSEEVDAKKSLLCVAGFPEIPRILGRVPDFSGGVAH